MLFYGTNGYNVIFKVLMKDGSSFSFQPIVTRKRKEVIDAIEFLKEKGVENPSILACIKGTKTARKAGRINSSTMKERGLGKIAIYVICAFVAGVGDLMMHILNTPTWMVSLVIGYMVVTEVLSVIENLSDAGVDVLDKLIGKLKGRL